MQIERKETLVTSLPDNIRFGSQRKDVLLSDKMPRVQVLLVRKQVALLKAPLNRNIQFAYFCRKALSIVLHVNCNSTNEPTVIKISSLTAKSQSASASATYRTLCFSSAMSQSKKWQVQAILSVEWRVKNAETGFLGHKCRNTLQIVLS